MRNKVILQKLISYIDKITAYCAEMDYAGFMSNTMLVEACVFNLSQLGELAGKLDDAFIQAHRDIPWRAIRGLRNRIVHDYEGVNLTLVWDVIQTDLPQLRQQLTTIK